MDTTPTLQCSLDKDAISDSAYYNFIKTPRSQVTLSARLAVIMIQQQQ